MKSDEGWAPGIRVIDLGADRLLVRYEEWTMLVIDEELLMLDTGAVVASVTATTYEEAVGHAKAVGRLTVIQGYDVLKAFEMTA